MTKKTQKTKKKQTQKPTGLSTREKTKHFDSIAGKKGSDTDA